MSATGSNRPFWEFDYTARDIAKGAEQQRDHRRSRIDAWTQAKANVMTEIRESGIEVSESMAVDMKSYSNTSGNVGPQVLVRADLQRKLTECHQKIQSHTRAAAEYDGWVQVLLANAESRLKLTQSDWLYFFGKV